MQASLRGEVEKFIDTILIDAKVLPSALTLFKEDLSPTVQNIEDALYGYVFGRTIQFVSDLIKVKERRKPNRDELLEVAGVIRRRALEIKSAIILLANR